MRLEQAVLLRAFVREDDKAGGLPLYEAIVLKAREMGLAGATVLRGPIGFGGSKRIHLAKPWHVALDLPIVIEIVDTRHRIDEFLPVLDGLMSSGIVTIENVSVMHAASSERGLQAG